MREKSVSSYLLEEVELPTDKLERQNKISTTILYAIFYLLGVLTGMLFVDFVTRLL